MPIGNISPQLAYFLEILCILSRCDWENNYYDASRVLSDISKTATVCIPELIIAAVRLLALSASSVDNIIFIKKCVETPRNGPDC